MNKDIVILYQYFSNRQILLKNRINSIIDRLLRSSYPITYSDLSELMQLTARLEESEKVESDLMSLLDFS